MLYKLSIKCNILELERLKGSTIQEKEGETLVKYKKHMVDWRWTISCGICSTAIQLPIDRTNSKRVEKFERGNVQKY